MTSEQTANRLASLGLASMGWRPFLQQQVEDVAIEHPARVAEVHRRHCVVWTESGVRSIESAFLPDPRDIAVGDWLLLDENGRPIRQLERETLIARRAAGTHVAEQLIAANVSTLFIVSSCDDDFSEGRLERYLALALDSNVHAVVVLTKVDRCDDPDSYRKRAEPLHRDLVVECVNAKDAATLTGLNAWCGPGQTVALVGSSGVGKSTLTNALAEAEQETKAVRELDSKGRHTTTTRSMHQLRAGGLLIDTPGMRELQLLPGDDGVDLLFDDVTEHLGQCKFRDCAHQTEPGCAIRKALQSGELDERRWQSYQKLQEEQAESTQTLAESRRRAKNQGRVYKAMQDRARINKGKS